jgi:DnaK suppressor protein
MLEGIMATRSKTNSKVTISPKYRPSDNEEYMSVKQLEYFRRKLLSWKENLLRESMETLERLRYENWHEPDPNDRASLEVETSFELRTRDRYRKLLDKIETALLKIETKEYGYCEETGEEIGLSRLEARPTASLSLEAQERHECYERQHSDYE